MDDEHVVIVGGGLAGLSAGVYARASGFRTTIIEHNLALGGVCTAWRRGPYTIDGCIHWLTGGPFMRVYEELGITRRVELRPLWHFSTLRDSRDGTEVELTADLPALGRALTAIAPEDGPEIERMLEAARHISAIEPPFDKPQDLYALTDGIRMIWDLRHELGTLVRFRKPLGEYLDDHVTSARLRRVLGGFLVAEIPAAFLLMVLGYLSRGWLSRPLGGTAAFRDALIDSYTSLGGESRLHTTVDEIVVENDRARGVRLHDGTLITADAVISTSSLPETVLRLLGGAYEAAVTRRRMREWKTIQPIVLASYGVAAPLTDVPPILQALGIPPFEAGGVTNDRLYLRVCNDDPTLAPSGHAVVQAMLPSDYDWWATRGAGYAAAKDEVAHQALEVIDRYVPGVKEACRVVDIATPITYWNMARSWRGAYEGWMPHGVMSSHISQRLEGLRSLYLAGQWVEPGGGVPMACSSGRQAVQLLCADLGRDFVLPEPERATWRPSELTPSADSVP